MSRDASVRKRTRGGRVLPGRGPAVVGLLGTMQHTMGVREEYPHTPTAQGDKAEVEEKAAVAVVHHPPGLVLRDGVKDPRKVRARIRKRRRVDVETGLSRIGRLVSIAGSVARRAIGKAMQSAQSSMSP